MTKTARKTISASCLGIVAIAWASCAAAAETACLGQAAPEQAYSAYIDAVKANNWELAFSHVEPDSRAKHFKDHIADLVVSMGMLAEEDKWLEFTSILKGHGFEVNAEHQLVLAETDWSKIKDRPQLMRQLSELMAANFGRKLAPDRYELTDIRTTEDKAVARLKLRRGKEKAVHFRKSDTGWCLAAR